MSRPHLQGPASRLHGWAEKHGSRVSDSSDSKPHPTRQREVGQHTDLVVRRLAQDDGREVVLSADLSRRL